MNRGDLILAIGTIKLFASLGNIEEVIKVCNSLLDLLIAEIDAENKTEQGLSEA
jgi:hypothetical protein